MQGWITTEKKQGGKHPDYAGKKGWTQQTKGELSELTWDKIN
jgi:hypothetical protein